MRNLPKTLATPCFGVVLAAALLLPGAGAAAGGSEWPSAGGNRQNTRFQETEHTLSVANVGGLQSEVGGHDSGRRLGHARRRRGHGVRARLGRQPVRGRPADRRVKWTASIPAATGAFLDKARVTPAVTDDKVIVGTQGWHPLRGRAGCQTARLQQVHRRARLEHAGRDPLRRDHHPVGDGVRRPVYVGVASQEEALAAFVPGYTLSFRGSMLALDLNSGAILWKTYDGPAALRLHGQRRLGQLAGDRHEARPGLHRDREQLFGPPEPSPACGGSGMGLPRPPACRRTTTSTASWRST